MRTVEINEAACVLCYSSNVKKNYTLKDGDTATASVRSLLYVFILKKRTVINLSEMNLTSRKKASCAHSHSSYFTMHCKVGHKPGNT